MTTGKPRQYRLPLLLLAVNLSGCAFFSRATRTSPPPPVLAPVEQTPVEATFMGLKPSESELWVCGWRKPEDTAKKLSCIPYSVFMREVEK